MSIVMSKTIADAVTRIDERLVGLTDEQCSELEEATSMDVGDLAVIRSAFAEEFAMGRLRHDLAQHLHGIADRWSDATLAERIVWMECGKEILAARVTRAS